MNINVAQQILQELYRLGVREIALCAGARNSPFVTVLDQAEGFKVYSFFEERSAAFFILGCARRTKSPAAVITTSGTAVAELLPAVVEAFHSGVPLVVVSADRPRRLRGSGAPQSIDQIGIFGKFVEHAYDIENQTLIVQNWPQQVPLHVNVCFDEPLLDAPVVKWRAGDSAAKAPTTGAVNVKVAKTLALSNSPGPLARGETAFNGFFARVLKPLVIVGTLETEDERQAVLECLTQWQLPSYLEAQSGLRERYREALRAGDVSLAWAMRAGHFDGVIRIGSVPTARIWRDLDDARTRLPVFSISSLPFSGLSDGEIYHGDIAAFCRQVLKNKIRSTASSPETSRAWRDKENQGREFLDTLLAKESLSEPGVFRDLSKLIPQDALVYVGNSLPIREWDLAANTNQPRHVQANRGVNGIDGQLSTFLGLCARNVREGWAIVGDLTALYDMTSPWALSLIDCKKINFVVINNSGGKIFSRIFNNPRFENRHSLKFTAWAALWALHYEHWTELPKRYEAARSSVIEIVPNPEATRRFYDAYDAFWKTP